MEQASKHLGVAAVKAPPFQPLELIERFRAIAPAKGFREQVFGEAAGCPLIAFTRRTPGPRPRVYLSAGIHGDEPAPPLALFTLLDRGLFDHRADWLLCPLLNPAGFLQATRENAAGVDLNRDYKATRSAEIAAHVAWLRRQPNFDLTLCLHEDWEAKGFYLYELNAFQRTSVAEPIVAAVRRHFPIDESEFIDERPAAKGILRPDPDPAKRELWPESIYLRTHHASLGYTLETPSGFPLTDRVAALQTAVTTALDRVLGPAAPPESPGRG